MNWSALTTETCPKTKRPPGENKIFAESLTFSSARNVAKDAKAIRHKINRFIKLPFKKYAGLYPKFTPIFPMARLNFKEGKNDA